MTGVLRNRREIWTHRSKMITGRQRQKLRVTLSKPENAWAPRSWKRQEGSSLVEALEGA